MKLEFWLSIGSTYSYLTVSRIQQVCRAAGLCADWHPFDVRELMNKTDNLPFPDSKPAKKKYMFRDIERKAKKYKLPLNTPILYPLKQYEIANRLAAVSYSEGWFADYAKETYRNWFERNMPAGDLANVELMAEALGKDSDSLLDKAAMGEAKSLLAHKTEEAESRGIFGAPSFIVAGELFWGDDRLEDAIEWAQAFAQKQ